MREIKTRIVEDHIAKPAAKNNPHRRINEKIIDVQWSERRRAAPKGFSSNQGPRIGPAKQEPGDIGQGIPANRQGADVDQHRIDARKGKSEEHGTPRVEWRCDGVFRPSAGLLRAHARFDEGQLAAFVSSVDRTLSRATAPSKPRRAAEINRPPRDPMV